MDFRDLCAPAIPCRSEGDTIPAKSEFNTLLDYLKVQYVQILLIYFFIYYWIINIVYRDDYYY